MTRLAYAFILFGLIAAGVTYDRVSSVPAEAVEVVVEREVINPSIQDPPRIDGAWFCPVGSSSLGGWGDHELHITNFSTDPAVAIVNILTDEGRGPGTRLEVGPLSSSRLKLSEYHQGGVAGAVVEVIGGEGVVGHSITGAHGTTQGPCATGVSSEWYFAAGRTKADSAQYLALMNPFPEAAAYDLQATSRVRQRSRPGQFVAPRSVKVVRLDDFFTTEEVTAASIKTQNGRLIVERFQVVDGSLGPAGSSVQLGVTKPESLWFFTGGRIARDGTNQLLLFNPAPTGLELLREDGAEIGADQVDQVFAIDQENTSTVQIDLWPTDPADLALYGVTTIERDVAPGGVEVIDLTAQTLRHGFPLPVEMSVQVQASDDLPVVAERWQSGTEFLADGVLGPLESEEEGVGENAEDGAENEADAPNPGDLDEPGGDFQLPAFDPGAELLPQPLAVGGLATSRGVSTLSDRWLVPWVTVVDDSTLVAVMAVEEVSVEVRTLVNGTLVGPIRATVPAGGRAIVPISTPGVDGAPVEVIATGPVAVEAVVVSGESFDVVAAIPVIE